MLFRTATLGCKVNQYETQYIRTALLANGFCEAAEDENELVDWVVINTCSVTGESDAKSRKLISYWGKKCPQAKIIVLGCYATANPQKVASFPKVAYVVDDKRKIIDFLKQWGLAIIPSGIETFSERHRAYVKIQDGCRVGCAYCIIPKIRHYLLSRTVPDIILETQKLIQNGYREIVLTGIHLGHYGLDFNARNDPDSFGLSNQSHKNSSTDQKNNGGNNQNIDQQEFQPESDKMKNGEQSESVWTLDDYLVAQEKLATNQRIDLAFLISHLMDHLSNVSEPFRLRLGSLEAVEVSDRLLDVLTQYQQKICHHLHLSMQSGDDSVLHKMRRRWLSGPFIEKCRQIQERFPLISLTTDIIVGFPGETESQFLRTCEVAEAIGFSKIHVFRFSPRTGTIAAQMEKQIPESVKKERAAHLLKISDRLRRNYAQSLLGKTTQLLVEEIRPVSDSLKSNFRPRTLDSTNSDAFNSLNRSVLNCSDQSEKCSKKQIVGTTDEYLPMNIVLPISASVQNGDLLSVMIQQFQGDNLIGILN
ncbi:MAG: radical SAM protein [Planctomycetia bacterium]|nr:radical SAM protein [Planctomycetia bacterium]